MAHPQACPLRVASSPLRGQHQQPGKAGSAVFLVWARDYGKVEVLK